ncbi:DUF3857 domain-containing protein [Hydrocarboniphaga sp.]|uniref:DUF3857 domain-containing protein n=1 Tax=Hydrocarboniphaga sp. TaxID=2033016 RepID=UPI003D1439A2
MKNFHRICQCLALTLLSVSIGSKAASSAKSLPADAAPDTTRYSITPAPAWVTPADETPAKTDPRAAMHYRLIDYQTRVGEHDTTEYEHVISVVDQQGGLSSASQINIEFDPSFQTLSVHRLQLIRGEQRINKLERRSIKLLQRETQLEQRMVDGRVTASIVLDDLRVGDQVDYEYSVSGQNPAFAGRYVRNQWMIAQHGPTASYRYRLLAPPSRDIRYRVGPSDVSVDSRLLGTMRETVFRRQSVPQLSIAPAADASAVPSLEIQLSEFRDWADVAQWGQQLFVEAPGVTTALDRKAAEIRAGGGDAAAQLLRTLQFVQTEIRYFGTEIGPNTHRPAAPAKILEQRFGDCKDKIALLLALLRRLDLPATPVLVSTGYRSYAANLLPSPLAFDHVIAAVRLGDTTYWLDGTRNHQTGSLANRQALGFGKGLPLDAGVSTLADLPSIYTQLRMRVDDTIRISRFRDDPQLESRITYRGNLAEGLREALGATNIDDIRTQVNQSYLRLYPKLSSNGPARIEESPDDNALTLIQQFSLPQFWRFPEQRALVADLSYWSLLEVLRFPADPTRQQALVIPQPGIFEHRLTLEYPEDVYKSAGSKTFNDGDSHYAFDSTLEGKQRSVVYSGRLTMKAERVESGEWKDYSSRLVKLTPQITFTTVVPAVALADMNGAALQKAADKALQQRKPKTGRKPQQASLLQIGLLTLQLDADRLSPALRAQTLKMRGTELDNLGQSDLGQADFDAALVLAPDDEETRSAAAVNAFARGDFARARALETALLDEHPGNWEVRYNRAISHYMARDYAAARQDIEDVLREPAAVRRGYPLLFLYLSVRAGGGDGAAALQPYLMQAQDLPTDWPRPLIERYLGNGSDSSVIDAAEAGKPQDERLCEAYFYMAEQHLADGDPRQARRYFEKAIDQQVTEYTEHGASQMELARLK